MNKKLFIGIILVALLAISSIVACAVRSSSNVSVGSNIGNEVGNSQNSTTEDNENNDWAGENHTTKVEFENETAHSHIDEIVTEPSGEGLLEESSNKNEEETSSSDKENFNDGTTSVNKPTDSNKETTSVSKPTQSPTVKPAEKETEKPTQKPTTKPTVKPTEAPTQKPTAKPTEPSTQKPNTKQNGEAELTDKKTEEVAEKIISEIISPSMTEFEKVFAIYEWMDAHIAFATEYAGFGVGKDYTVVSEPKYVLESHRAIGYGYANTFNLLAKKAGLDSVYIYGMYSVSGQGSGNTAWNQVNIDNIWYNVDTCYSSNYSCFLVSDDDMNLNYSTIYDGKHLCKTTYDREKIKKHNNLIEYTQAGKNVIWAESVEFAIKEIIKLSKANVKEIELWYYEDSLTYSEWRKREEEILEVMPYPYDTYRSTYSYGDGLGKLSFNLLVTDSEMKNLPVVRTDEELKEALVASFDAGNTTVMILLIESNVWHIDAGPYIVEFERLGYYKDGSLALFTCTGTWEMY